VLIGSSFQGLNTQVVDILLVWSIKKMATKGLDDAGIYVGYFVSILIFVGGIVGIWIFRRGLARYEIDMEKEEELEK
jgi:hypothetical protein